MNPLFSFKVFIEFYARILLKNQTNTQLQRSEALVRRDAGLSSPHSYSQISHDRSNFRDPSTKNNNQRISSLASESKQTTQLAENNRRSPTPSLHSARLVPWRAARRRGDAVRLAKCSRARPQPQPSPRRSQYRALHLRAGARALSSPLPFLQSARAVVYVCVPCRPGHVQQ